MLTQNIYLVTVAMVVVLITKYSGDDHSGNNRFVVVLVMMIRHGIGDDDSGSRVVVRVVVEVM